MNKIPRVKIYLSIDQILKSFFKKTEKSKKKIKKLLKENLNKEYIIFFGMCRSAFMVVLEYLKIIIPLKMKLLFVLTILKK